MNVISKFRHSWALARLCLGVLARNKKLLVFPIITFCFWLLMIVLFFAPVTLMHTGYSLWQSEHWQKVGETVGQKFVKVTETRTRGGVNRNVTAGIATTEQWAFWLAIYVGAMLVGTFANVAFYHEILSALRNGPVSIRSGIAFALSRWQAILFWSLFAGLVGLLIRTIEEKVGWIGRLIMGFLGLAWSGACLFVIPVLVETDSTNPVNALKRSATILVKTWGEAIIGFSGIAAGRALLTLGTFFTFGVAIALGIWLQTFWIPATTVISWLFVLFAYAYVMSVAGDIYRGALYLYAAEGQVVPGFSTEMLNNCWRRKGAAK